MNKKILSVVLLVTIISALVYFNGGLNLFNFSRTAYAVGDLTVDWGVGVGDVGPIFTVSNMAPGGSQSHQVTVTNASPQNRSVGIRGIKNTETGALASAMDIVIAKDGSPVYGTGSVTGARTMAQFFTESTLPNFVTLSTLVPAESEVYTITVTFKSESGNEFQNKTLSFNLAIGIGTDVPVACQAITFTGNPIFGTSGNDNLRGTNKNDLIFSLEGNDTVDGGNGNDCIVDGNGNGRLTGGNGDDVISAANGNTTIDGGNGDDAVLAGAGNDIIDGGNGDDDLNGEGDNDQIEGGNGSDTILGGAGNDQLLGGLGNDSLNGEAGTDSANGSLGRDTCIAETKTACEL